MSSEHPRLPNISIIDPNNNAVLANANNNDDEPSSSSSASSGTDNENEGYSQSDSDDEEEDEDDEITYHPSPNRKSKLRKRPLHSNKNERDTEYGNCELLGEIFKLMIPEELTKLIFAHLPLQTKKACRLVSYHFLSLVDPLFRFELELNDSTALNVITFSQQDYKPDTLRIKKLQRFIYPEEGLRLKTVKTLHISGHPSTPTPLIERNGVSPQNLRNILKDFKNIDEFILNSRGIKDVPVPSPLRELEFENLTTLQISANTDDNKGYLSCMEILHNFFLNLRDIKVAILYQKASIFLQHPPFYKEIFRFVARHSRTLKSFFLLHCNVTNEMALPPMVFDQDHAIPQPEYESLVDCLQQVNLNEYFYAPSYYEGRQRFNFGVHLLNCQLTLTRLQLSNLSRSNIGLFNAGLQVMGRCSETLKIIELFGSFIPETRPMDEFSCSLLRNIRNLACLKISIRGLKIVDVEHLPKHIIVLLLGRGLNHPQIEFITENMKEIEEWDLTQDRAAFDRTVMKVNTNLFRNVITRMPALKRLVLTKRCCSWKRIRKIISYTQGLSIAETQPMQDPIDDKRFVKVQIDRKRLELDRL